MDVDGVLTDGNVVWGVDEAGKLLELKEFSVRDGLAISLIRTLGYEVAWITGRTSAIVEKRASELGVREVHQGSRNKQAVLAGIMERLGFAREQVLYMGDDLNDLPAFEAAGVRVTVADAATDVRDRADWVTAAAGGAGAVREVIEHLLRTQGRWEEGVEALLARLRTEQSRPLQ
jgi:3-deoxy-D-manno-octulosonate 8-phosphate phosphatase (KDO 8-P phosphatase)